MTTIDVGNNDRLDFEPARDALRLTPGVGGAAIKLQLKVGRAVEAGDFRYTRAEAGGLLATTAGLLNRLAEQG